MTEKVYVVLELTPVDTLSLQSLAVTNLVRRLMTDRLGFGMEGGESKFLADIQVRAALLLEKEDGGDRTFLRVSEWDGKATN